MTVIRFEGFVWGARNVFRMILRGKKNDMEFMKKYLKNLLEYCTNDFEELCLKENLQEEFMEYLEEVKVA